MQVQQTGGAAAPTQKRKKQERSDDRDKQRPLEQFAVTAHQRVCGVLTFTTPAPTVGLISAVRPLADNALDVAITSRAEQITAADHVALVLGCRLDRRRSCNHAVNTEGATR